MYTAYVIRLCMSSKGKVMLLFIDVQILPQPPLPKSVTNLIHKEYYMVARKFISSVNQISRV